MTQGISRSRALPVRLVQLAAGKAPPALRARLEEEWLADLADRQGGLSRLKFAVGCHWASRVIAIEHPVLRLASVGDPRHEVATPPGGGRRTASVLLVVILHALIFYACWVSLARTQHVKQLGDIQYTPVPAPPIRTFQPSNGVEMKRIAFIGLTPPTDAPIDASTVVAGSADLVQPSSSAEPSPAAPETKPASHRVLGGPASGFPPVDDFYPAVAIRAGEQGSAIVQVCVNAAGRLDAEPAVLQSSGFTKLDAAALKLAKAGSGHYRPTSEDNHAVSSCFAFAVRFQLRSVR